MPIPELEPRITPAASVAQSISGYRLEIPSGSKQGYRLAQLDDYSRQPRRHFPHASPYILSLQMRISSNALPGTWGFGLWNDPFGLSLGFGGSPFRLPTLPQAAWFFFGSPENSLSLTDLPSNGFITGTFASPRIPAILFAPLAPMLALLPVRGLSRLARKFASKFVHQSGTALDLDVTAWHKYQIEWQKKKCRFLVDDRLALETTIVPLAPLGLVIWIDNQYAAWKPDGRSGFGTLGNPSAWMEIKDLRTGG